MISKRWVAPVVVCMIAGAAVITFVHPGIGSRKPSEKQVEAGRPDAASAGSTSNISTAQLQTQSPVVIASEPRDAVVNETNPPTSEEKARAGRERNDQRMAAAEDADTMRLVTAGFSQERIAWLRLRRDELQAQQKKADYQASQNGGPFNLSSSAQLWDKDLILRNELDDDEYMKYRQALRKPISISVTQVLSGSNADIAGIRAGDQIVRYGGMRIFDHNELESLSKFGTSGGAVVQVLRIGQEFSVSLPNGPTGLNANAPSPAMSAIENFFRR